MASRIIHSSAWRVMDLRTTDARERSGPGVDGDEIIGGVSGHHVHRLRSARNIRCSSFFPLLLRKDVCFYARMGKLCCSVEEQMLALFSPLLLRSLALILFFPSGLFSFSPVPGGCFYDIRPLHAARSGFFSSLTIETMGASCCAFLFSGMGL